MKSPFALLGFLIAFLLIPFFFVPGFAADASSYESLLTELQGLHQEREFETPREVVQRNWKTGVLVNAFVHADAPNSEVHELLVKLEDDLGKGQRYFADVRDFARDYPAGPPDIDLPWTYFTITAPMKNPVQREALLKQAAAEHWDTRRLDREAWKARFGKEKEEPAELEAQAGRPGIYRIVHPNSYLGAAPSGDKDAPVRQLSFQLGFDTFRTLPPEDAAKFKEGDTVKCEAMACEVTSDFSPADFFTRRASIVKITDGDTLTANIDLGFGIETQKKMRLRGIDAPETDTEAGRDAKAHLEKLLSQGNVLVRAEKTDKYNRTLADLWACPARNDQVSADGTRTTRDECVYVNRKMLDDGFAGAMEE